MLSGNQFSGGIPIGLFVYENLTMLDLSQNSLTGDVPDEFLKLRSILVWFGGLIDGAAEAVGSGVAAGSACVWAVVALLLIAVLAGKNKNSNSGRTQKGWGLELDR